MDLKEIELLGPEQDRHWYYVSKTAALRECLGGYQPRQILDVGAGSGYFAKTLLRSTTALSAVCVDPGYEREWSESLGAKPVIFRRSASTDEADLVLLMDVLEHIEDDQALLNQFVRPALAGTRFVVSVPAFQWIWSSHDEFLRHKRRYTLTAVQRLLSTAGLESIGGFYFFAAVFPIVAAMRLGTRVFGPSRPAESDLKRHSPWTNALLTAVCAAEAPVARHNSAFGLTAFAFGQKPKT